MKKNVPTATLWISRPPTTMLEVWGMVYVDRLLC